MADENSFDSAHMVKQVGDDFDNFEVAGRTAAAAVAAPAAVAAAVGQHRSQRVHC